MRRIIRTRFDEVAIKGVRRWKDPATGKPRQETKKFFQTINPFNRNAAGETKSREEIMVEIKAERDAWVAAGQAVGSSEKGGAAC
jgi:hypothetical protein